MTGEKDVFLAGQVVPFTHFRVFNLTDQTGLFGAAEERFVFQRPINHNAVTAAVAITVLSILGVTLLLHLGLFLKSQALCEYVVRRRLHGKNLSVAEQPGIDWSVRYDTQAADYVVIIGGKQVGVGYVVISSIVGDYGPLRCTEAAKHKGLTEWAFHSLSN